MKRDGLLGVQRYNVLYKPRYSLIQQIKTTGSCNEYIFSLLDQLVFGIFKIVYFHKSQLNNMIPQINY